MFANSNSWDFFPRLCYCLVHVYRRYYLCILSKDKLVIFAHLPRGHLQNFPGDSLTNMSFTASSKGPRIRTGLGEVQSTFCTR